MTSSALCNGFLSHHENYSRVQSSYKEFSLPFPFHIPNRNRPNAAVVSFLIKMSLCLSQGKVE